jgi:hypothetical protein
MHSARAGVAAALLAGLVLIACTAPGASPPNPVQIGLQGGDLPAELRPCPDSGAIDPYLRALERTGPQAQAELAAAWHDLRGRGAVEAAVAGYATQPAACGARLGTGDGPSASTLVVRFRDGGTASAAYQQGVLGFTTPSEDAEVPDMTRGAATGLGRDAWVLERSVAGRALVVGLWERDTVLVLFVAVDVDPLHAKQALSSVDGRIP